MKIVRVDSRHPDRRTLREAADVLKQGGLVVYPTETAYALGCDAANPKAMRRIYAVKGREKGKALPLIVASLAQARRVARFDACSLALAKKYWPGPLTIVVGKDAIRVSPNPIAHALASALGRPIVSTSANRSGAATKYDVEQILGDLGLMPDLVIDAGPLRPTPPSTIVKCDGQGYVILRQGKVKIR